MSSSASYSFLGKANAAKVAALDQGVVELVIKLAAMRLKPPALLAYATEVAQGKVPTAALSVGTPKPVTIQAHSWLNDPRQYADRYGVSEEDVRNLRSLYQDDSAACMDRISAIVTDFLRKTGSQKAVRVVSTGDPGTNPATANPLAGSRGLVASYASEIRSNSGVYGSYTFETFETGRDVTQAFGVDLGHEVYVLAQSKKMAIMVARIATVKGRTDPLALPYIYYISSGGRAVVGDEIPADIWNCLRSAREPRSPSVRKPRAAEPPAGAPVPPTTPASRPKTGESSRSVVG
ncbi:capsid protein [Colletotrichum camelliae filamentous virus 1]|uniref:Capsid protein n=1 Tax=Colletotrichum camelliae filamentous virus 1 TaxID=2029458 RepID=A0A286M3N1_9VIRU|nr:capsid protein [Colletotrichum camelliae filamentous virus 1]ASV63095.1 capsid protein [Colletotrichum camelliae filamentous virus 1]